MKVISFEIIGDTETNGLGDFNWTMLIDDGSENGVVLVGTYAEEENRLDFIIADDEEYTDERQELIENFFKTHRKYIIEAILR